MAALLKELRQHAAYLAAAAGQHDAQGADGLKAWNVHAISVTRSRALDGSYWCGGSG
jgi:hypothetical protein